MNFRNIQGVNRQISVLERCPGWAFHVLFFLLLTRGWKVPGNDREVSVRLIALLQNGMKHPDEKTVSVRLAVFQI